MPVFFVWYTINMKYSIDKPPSIADQHKHIMKLKNIIAGFEASSTLLNLQAPYKTVLQRAEKKLAQALSRQRSAFKGRENKV